MYKSDQILIDKTPQFSFKFIEEEIDNTIFLITYVLSLTTAIFGNLERIYMLMFPNLILQIVK